MSITHKEKLIAAAVVIVLIAIAGYYLHYAAYTRGYKTGYDAGYAAGYSERNKLAEKEISDAVAANTKTETKIVYKEIPYNGNDVQVRTEKPVITVSVNGKQQKIEQQTATADLAVKTETAVRIKIPERKWKFGIGTDGKKPAYMLSAPIKNAIGVWVAGSGRDKIMGGVTISF